MGSIVLQQVPQPIETLFNQHDSDDLKQEEKLFMMRKKIYKIGDIYPSTSSTAFEMERGNISFLSDDDVIDEAIVIQHDDNHHDEGEYHNDKDPSSQLKPTHLQIEARLEDRTTIPTGFSSSVSAQTTDDDVDSLLLGSSLDEGSSTTTILDQARKNNSNNSTTLSQEDFDDEVKNYYWSESVSTSTTTASSDINNYSTAEHNYYHHHQYHDNSEEDFVGMNERSNIENNAQSLVDHQQNEQACEHEKQLYQNTTLRKTCNEEILLHNSNDSIIIRSYNYETDEKQVNKIFVEGIKSIVPTYLQTFYLFIHYFGIIQVFAILSLFYISSFIFQFGIIKLLFNPDDLSTTSTTSLLSIILSFTNLSASSTIYAIISTFITCTSMVILILCGLSKYVDYSARSYIYQQFKFSDMSNIQKFYIWDEDNHFWVAQLKSTGEIVGTIGVRKRPQSQEDTVELKRMSVSSSMKRKGVASLMLNHLVKWSKEKGYKTITLSTSSLQAAAVDFYKKNGFSVVKMRRYSRFLPTAHLTFEKHL